jgi:hypothetical protein
MPSWRGVQLKEAQGQIYFYFTLGCYRNTDVSLYKLTVPSMRYIGKANRLQFSAQLRNFHNVVMSLKQGTASAHQSIFRWTEWIPVRANKARYKTSRYLAG